MKPEIFSKDEMVAIPPSLFTMGDIWNDGYDDEQPIFETYVDSFFLNKFTVSNYQFLNFLNDIQDYRTPKGLVIIDLKNNNKNRSIYYDKSKFVCNEAYYDYPVVYVSWWGAVCYCDWLTGKVGFQISLPSEIQWQYAAMGPRKLKWGLSNEFDASKYVISHHEGPQPVYYSSPSEWGLHNMTGNVFEWCTDEYALRLNNKNENNILKKHRVIKGSAFSLNDNINFRNSKRFSCFENSCLNCIGFRIASKFIPE